MKKRKKQLWVFVYIKYGKFWSNFLELFIKHKPLFSEEWVRARRAFFFCLTPYCAMDYTTTCTCIFLHDEEKTWTKFLVFSYIISVKKCSKLKFWPENLISNFFFTHFTEQNIPHTNFFRRNFCIENGYL